MNAPHPDLLKTLPSEAELIEAERLLSIVEQTPAQFIFRGADMDWWDGGWDQGAKARVPDIMRRLIKFAREHQ
jgi:hypothetical protein